MSSVAIACGLPESSYFSASLPLSGSRGGFTPSCSLLQCHLSTPHKLSRRSGPQLKELNVIFALSIGCVPPKCRSSKSLRQELEPWVQLCLDCDLVSFADTGRNARTVHCPSSSAQTTQHPATLRDYPQIFQAQIGWALDKCCTVEPLQHLSGSWGT